MKKINGARKKRTIIMADWSIEEKKSRNKYYWLKDKDLLTPITSEDYDFALKVKNEYDVNLDDLCWLIRDIREGIQKGLSGFREEMLSFDKNLWEMFCGPGIEFRKISITSNKGTIDIDATHPFFEYYFYPQIKRIELLRSKTLSSQNKEIAKWLVDLPLRRIWLFFNRTTLGKFQQRVVTGLLLVHFKLFKNRPIITAEEWKENPTQAISYKHYLSDIVKTRLKD